MNSIVTKISIIIPARNEEKRLPICISAINKAYEYLEANKTFINSFSNLPVLEIVVVENRSSDQTEQVARSLGCIIVKSTAKNLSMIRNAGVKIASGDVIITVDADSSMSPNSLVNICKCLNTNKYIGGGVLIVPDRFSLGIFCTILALVPIALYYGISAGLFFCFKKDFDAIGGFNESMSSVEDIDFAVRLKAQAKQQNKKFKNLYGSYILTSSRKFDKFGDWYFFKNPIKMIRLFKGNSQKDADELWYDFEE